MRGSSVFCICKGDTPTIRTHCRRTHPDVELGRLGGVELRYDGALRAYSVGGSSALNIEKNFERN